MFIHKYISVIIVGLLLLSSCGKPQKPSGQEGKAKESTTTLDKEAGQGKELYLKYGCQQCHGIEGKGDGPAGKSLKPPPRDYKDLSSYKQGSSQKDIANTLLTGVPGTSMAPYPHIKEEERRKISAYVIYLQKK